MTRDSCVGLDLPYLPFPCLIPFPSLPLTPALVLTMQWRLEWSERPAQVGRARPAERRKAIQRTISAKKLLRGVEFYLNEMADDECSSVPLVQLSLVLPDQSLRPMIPMSQSQPRSSDSMHLANLKRAGMKR